MPARPPAIGGGRKPIRGGGPGVCVVHPMAAAPAAGYAAGMKFSRSRLVLAVLTAAFVTVAAAGCNTASGFGKDVEKLGDKIEKKASR